jgi:hypothetical protein
MAKQKLAPSNDWRNRQVTDWTTATFKAYMQDKHKELFGIPYYPFGTWQIDQGFVKACVTEYGQEVVKRFIDLAFESYEPTPNYPGTSFGFCFRYRNNLLQRAALEAKNKTEDKAYVDERLRKLEDDDLDWI